MVRIPQTVLKTLDELRGKYAERLSLKMISGRFYLYKEHGIWLKDKQKNKTISEYIGSINYDGTFKEKEIRYRSELDKAKTIIEAHGGEITWRNDLKNNDLNLHKERTADDTDLKILTFLSMNSRANYTRIGKSVGLSAAATYNRIKRLEQKFGIKYMLEIDREKLGYTRFIGFVKFHDKKPSLKELQESIKGEPRIQFAAFVNGEYDVIFYLIEELSDEAIDIVWKMRSESQLKNYSADWIITPMSNNYGYLPLGQEFFGKEILKKKVWHRSKETPRPQEDQLTEREFDVIKELNKDGSVGFKKIDEIYKFPNGTSNYIYTRLKDRGIIKRPTISMEKLPLKYISVIMMKFINNSKYNPHRKNFLMEVMKDGSISNKYVLEGDIGSPYSSLLFYPITKENELDLTLNDMHEKIDGVNISVLTITTIISGSLCYRRFDNSYSRQHRLLVSMNALKPKELELY